MKSWRAHSEPPGEFLQDQLREWSCEVGSHSPGFAPRAKGLEEVFGLREESEHLDRIASDRAEFG